MEELILYPKNQALKKFPGEVILKNEVLFWLYFLIHAGSKDPLLEEIVITHEEIQRAKAQYNDMFTDDQIRDALENQEKARLIQRDVLATAKQSGIEEGMALGIQQGMDQGRSQGRQEAQRDLARKLLAKGFGVQETAEMTGLPEAEVLKLQGL